jgi:hypothetical protein
LRVRNGSLRATFIAHEGQQMFPLAKTLEVDAGDLLGLAETPFPAAANDAAIAVRSSRADGIVLFLHEFHNDTQARQIGSCEGHVRNFDHLKLALRVDREERWLG